jgi:hypothetical protein
VVFEGYFPTRLFLESAFSDIFALSWPSIHPESTQTAHPANAMAVGGVFIGTEENS